VGYRVEEDVPEEGSRGVTLSRGHGCESAMIII
jgi:hypothetical protein